MFSRLLVSVACAGCQVVFPLRDRAEVTPPPTTCPDDHGAPRFDTVLTKVIDDTCTLYSEAPDTDLAVCSNVIDVLTQGPIGMAPVPALFDPPLAAHTLFTATVHPEGDQLTALLYLEGSGATIEVYRQVATAWQHVATSPSVGNAMMGIPSRGPDARMMVYDPNRMMVVELAQATDGGWTSVATTMPEQFGTVRPLSSMMNLSPDGRRVIFRTADKNIGYAFRNTVDEPFAEASLIDAPAHEAATWVVMSEECEQLAGSFATGGVYVAPQR